MSPIICNAALITGTMFYLYPNKSESFKQIAASIVTLMVGPMLIRIGNCAKEKWLIET